MKLEATASSPIYEKEMSGNNNIDMKKQNKQKLVPTTEQRPLIQEIVEESKFSAVKMTRIEIEMDDDEEKDVEGVEEAEVGEGEDEEEGEEGDGNQMISCVLGILSAMLALGNESRTKKEETALSNLVWSLHVIAFRESSSNLSQTASDVAMLLLTRTCSPLIPSSLSSSSSSSSAITSASTSSSSSSSSSSSASTSVSPFCSLLFSILNDFCTSIDPPMRSFGVHKLSLAITDYSEVPAYLQLYLHFSYVCQTVFSS